MPARPAVYPEQTADSDDQDPQDIIDEFDHELQVSDEALVRMDEGTFRDWMEAMTDGIACLAHESLEAKARADRETRKSRSALRSIDIVRGNRDGRIEEWRKSWRTDEIRALTVRAVLDRPKYKANFGYLAHCFMSLDWFLVSVVHRGL